MIVLLSNDGAELPPELVATTLKAYAESLLNDETEQVKSAVVQESEPGIEEAVYEVAPSDGAQETTAEVSPATAVTAGGANGAARGITTLLTKDFTEVPPVFVAVTVNVYDVPLIKGETEQNVNTEIQVTPPGDEESV